MRTGQSIPVGQQNLVFINMQMLPLFQSAAQRPAEEKKQNTLKLNLPDETSRCVSFISLQAKLNWRGTDQWSHKKILKNCSLFLM